MGLAARLLVGLALVCLALGIQAVLWELSPPSPFLLVYPAVFVAAWLGGWASASVTTLGSMVALAWWFMPPSDSIAINAERDALDLGIFFAMSMLITWLVVRAKRAIFEASAAREVAERATAAKDAVLAVVAHDLRNPLQTITLSAELLSTSSEPGAQTSARAYRIQRAAERARRLVDNILESATVEGAPLPIVPEVVSLSSLIDESMAPLKSMADERQIHLEVGGDPATGSLVCDRDRIVQVLGNLVGNSLKYTPAGGAIRVEIRREREALRFDVSDSGKGMSAEELAHAFDRLWHGRDSRHGTGLGLWITKALVEGHGGRITATSELGRGTRMSFVLPQPPFAEFDGAALAAT
jgi:signal transduction histidine kinase